MHGQEDRKTSMRFCPKGINVQCYANSQTQCSPPLLQLLLSLLLGLLPQLYQHFLLGWGQNLHQAPVLNPGQVVTQHCTASELHDVQALAGAAEVIEYMLVKEAFGAGRLV